jgi:hypothetical protein
VPNVFVSLSISVTEILSKNIFRNSLVPPCSSGKLSVKQNLNSEEFKNAVKNAIFLPVIGVVDY